MNVMKNYYQILEVEDTASAADIKKAYRKLAQKYHPDRNQDSDADLKFKEINEANEVLSDAAKRRQYDSSRQGGFGGEIGDLFESLFGGRFSSRRGSTPNVQRAPTPGSAIVAVELTLDELESGHITRTFQVQKDVICKHCSGRGGDDIAVCQNCNGSGGVSQYFRQGNMKFRSDRPCPNCHGEGKRIINICAKCSGAGVIDEQNTFTISISSHKS